MAIIAFPLGITDKVAFASDQRRVAVVIPLMSGLYDGKDVKFMTTEVSDKQ